MRLYSSNKTSVNIFIVIHPLAKLTNDITKAYVGAVTKKLEHLTIDRGFYALLLIEQHNEQLSQKELAALMTTDKVCMVRMIDYLSLKGFVQRETNTKDRRAHYITLTDKAKEIIPEIKEAFKSVNETALKQLQHKQELWTDLERIYNSLIEIPHREVKFNFKSTKSK